MAVFAGFTMAAFFKSIVVGAVVGAVVGGITAAIKGGDIMKGVLFGAVGGAVTGGLLYGGSVVVGNLTSASTTAYSNAATSMQATGSRSMENAALSTATTSKGGGVATSFVDDLWSDIGSGFKSSGTTGALGDAMTKGAVSAGISTVGQVYMQGKAADAAKEAAEQAHLRNLETIDKQADAQIKVGSALGRGGGGGGSDTDELAIVKEQNKGAYARVMAEIEGQRDLRQMDYDEQNARTQEAALTGSTITTGSAVASRSKDSLVDVQNRIREGENAEGDPDAGYVVPVTYTVQPDETRRVV